MTGPGTKCWSHPTSAAPRGRHGQPSPTVSLDNKSGKPIIVAARRCATRAGALAARLPIGRIMKICVATIAACFSAYAVASTAPAHARPDPAVSVDRATAIEARAKDAARDPNTGIADVQLAANTPRRYLNYPCQDYNPVKKTCGRRRYQEPR